MAQQRRGYAASAAARAAQMNLDSGRRPERVREPNYQDERAKYGAMFMNPGSDNEPSPEPTLAPTRRPRPPPFLFHFDVDDSDSGSESTDIEEEGSISELRSAYSEPTLSAPPQTSHHRDPRHQDHRKDHHQRRAHPQSHYTQASPLDSKEREALLERVRRLSSSEAETAAALARATAENAVLAEEASHWRAVAKEAASSRRAAREALSEVSAENARLAAAYSAQRLEAAALQEALTHERSQAEARVVQLEQALRTAESHIDALSKGGKPSSNGGERFREGNDHAAPFQTATDNSQQHHASNEEGAGSYPNYSSSNGAWDQERQDLLGLLERLQEQLAAHAAQQEREQQQQHQQRRTPSGRRHQAPSPAPPSGPAAEDERTPQRSRGTPVATSRFEFNAAADQTPNNANFASWQQSPQPRSGMSTPVHSNFKMPAGFTNTGSASKEPGVASAFKTPATAEPVGLRYESSYEESTTTTKASAGHRQPKEASKSTQATPMAATPPLSATRPSSGDRPAATTPPSATHAAMPAEEPPISAKKTLPELKAAADKLVQQKRYDAALQQYNAALTEAESLQDSSGIVAVLCSRASALTAVGRFLESAADCCRAEKAAARRGCPRAIDLRAEAFSLMGAYELAAEDLQWLRKVSESNGSGGPTPALTARLQDARRAAAEATPRNHYAVLGVKSCATSAEIKSSYKTLALRLHPDKAADTLGHESATTLFSLLSAAHTTLGNTQSRRTYDLQLLRQKYAMGADNGGSRQGGTGSPGPQWGWR